MDHATRVRLVQRLPQLRHHRDNLAQREQASLRDAPAQGAPIDVLHHQILGLAVVPDVVDRHDMRMGQARRHAGLLFEAPHYVGAAQQFRVQEFDRHDAIELPIVRAVHAPHTPVPNEFE